MNSELVRLVLEARRDYLSEKNIQIFVVDPLLKNQAMMALCVNKNVDMIQDVNVYVQLGLQAFMFFPEETSFNQRERTYTDFRQSNYYNAFCKFGKFMIDYNVINPKTLYGIYYSSKFKLDKWCTESYYTDWLP